MRGEDRSSGSLFSYVDLEGRVPVDHPLRLIRELVNDVLRSLSSEFEAHYSHMGRPSIPPEQLLRALLLQAFYSIRSERQLMEQLNFNMLFRWFVGLGLDDGVWDASTFCHNRDRLLDAEVSAKLLTGVVEHRKVRGLLSRDHFSVDGTLIEAWASMKSFRPKGEDDGEGGSGRNADRDFHGEKRSKATHVSTTDPEARLYRKGNGRESKLCYMGHALMENRHGLVDTQGLLLHGIVTAADVQDRDGGLALLATLRSVSLSREIVRRQRLSGAGLSPRPGRHPARSRDRDRQAIRSGEGLRHPAQALGGRTHHRLAQPLPPTGQGLGEPQPQRARLHQARVHSTHAPKTL